MQKVIAGVALGLAATVLIMLLAGVDANAGRLPIESGDQPIPVSPRPDEAHTRRSLSPRGTARVDRSGSSVRAASPHGVWGLPDGTKSPATLKDIVEVWRRHGGLLDATPWGHDPEHDQEALFLASLERAAGDCSESRETGRPSAESSPPVPAFFSPATNAAPEDPQSVVVSQLRRMSLRLEQQAGQLENEQHYASADRLRVVATRLRDEARFLQRARD